MGAKEAGAAIGQGKVKPRLPKRFYQDVAVKDEGAGAALLLDGKPVRTPGKAPLGAADARRWPKRSPRSGARKASASIPRPCRSPGLPTAPSTACRARAGGDRRHHASCRLGPALLPRAGTAGPGRGAGEALGSRACLGRRTRSARRCAWSRAWCMSRSRKPRSTRSSARLAGVDAFSLAALHVMTRSRARPCLRSPWRSGG